MRPYLLRSSLAVLSLVFSCGSTVTRAAPAAAGATRKGHHQVWQIIEGTTTLTLNRGATATTAVVHDPSGRRARPTKPPAFRAPVEFAIEPGSQLIVDVSNGDFVIADGFLGHTEALDLQAGAAGHTLFDFVIQPERTAGGNAFRAVDAMAGDGEGLLMTTAQLRLDFASNTLFISTDDVTLTGGLSHRLHPARSPDGSQRPDTPESLGGVLIRARFERIDSDEPVIPRSAYSGTAVGEGGGVIGPDVTVWSVGAVGSYGVEFDANRGEHVSAFAIATTSCNQGDEPAIWVADTPEHPVIAQHMYRLRNNRFEQIGMSWVKHAFFATTAFACGDCINPCPDPCGQPNPCPECPTGTRLGISCSDLYSASLNGSQGNLGPRSQINAFTGVFPYPYAVPAPIRTIIDRRLQIRNRDLDPAENAGALYYGEGQYVTTDEPAFGNQHNNVSYHRMLVLPEEIGGCSPQGVEPGFCINPSGSTVREEPAIRAWKQNDDSVVETDIWVPDAEMGQEGFMVLAAKAHEIGSGLWRYEYALQNVTSDRSVGSFSVPLPDGAALTNIGFHDVDYHSGEPFDGTDWGHAITDGIEHDAITWATAPYETPTPCTTHAECPDRCDFVNGLCTNPNANALRWGTLYNFRFDANVPPEESKDPRPVTVTLGLFKPGDPSEAQVMTIGPSTGFIDCNRNGTTDRCDIACSKECPEPCGGSEDCNGNSVPDECEPDCNENGTADECDILGGTSEDCDGNMVPDECDPDCDGDGIIDACETVFDTDQDCVLDCDDQCPETTPAEACCCELECCYPSGICIPGLTLDQCLSIDPPGEPTCIVEPCRSGCLIGDRDGDGDLDLHDASGVQQCFSSAAGSAAYVRPSDDCLLWFDFDEDTDVDLFDADRWVDIQRGPGMPDQ